MRRTLFLIGFIICLSGFSQEIPYPPLSPKGSIKQVIGNTNFEITYERPSVRGRVIYGGLVPWNEVWRTGAGHCTVISFDRPVKIFEQEIPAGAYSIFTKPGQAEWYFMINKDTAQRGTRNYTSAKDIIQFISKPEKTKRLYETITFDIEMVDNNALVSLSWERTKVSFMIETSTNDEINSLIKANLLSGDDTNPRNYTEGADFLVKRGEDLPMALLLINRAIELDPKMEAPRNLKIKICEKLGNYQEALDEIDATITLLRSIGDRSEEIKGYEKARQRIEKLNKKKK